MLQEKEDEIKGGMEGAGSVTFPSLKTHSLRQDKTYPIRLPSQTLLLPPFLTRTDASLRFSSPSFRPKRSRERTFISLNSDKLYNYDSNALEQRRKVVEVGKGCESLDDKRAREIYESDCSLSSYFSCRTDPSLPFRLCGLEAEAADWNGWHLGGSSRGEDGVLSQIPSMVHGSESVRIAIIRMAVLHDMSAVVYIRSGQQISSPFHGFLHALKIASMDDHDQKFRHESGIVKVATDAACNCSRSRAERKCKLAWRALLADNYSRVVVSELVGCFVSFAHLLLRYACLKFDLKKEPPLSKLQVPCPSAIRPPPSSSPFPTPLCSDHTTKSLTR